MIKILFVCHGNICRSPMAEFVLRDMVKKAGCMADFNIDSAATSREELGNPVYPPAKKKLREHGIGTPENDLGVSTKRARQITDSDYETYDYLIGMDSANIRNMKQKYRNDPDGIIYSLMDFTDRPGSVADPWYTGDFEATWQDVSEGCECLLHYLQNKNGGH